MMNFSYKAAAIQLVSGVEPEANLQEAGKLVAQAARDGARLVVLPENFACMGRQGDSRGIRESHGHGPLQGFLSGLAREHGVWLIGGTIPLQAEDVRKERAASLVFDDQGNEVCRYDKIHLFDADVEGGERHRESDNIEPGANPVIWDTPFGRLGLSVCYDVRFPELFRFRSQGPDIIAVPSAFTAVTGKAHWEVLVRARAIENVAYVIAAAQGGVHENGRETHGHSMIVDPWGRILASHEREAGIVVAEIDPDSLQAARRSIPCLANRRIFCDG
uniref:Nitrilase n=1 Tax=Candidatus Kentrum sp. MB TaxID=2138164 RepID=A0A450XT33_9GAMM|nr:MAG: nitrilase [Candidatus Kentron sp. MB]VFK32408.1 MAG: nitrilase [Candidatus Kentron sp. MB]VFK76191.1 MAG: nitrilase [Candidatus Kentron sp. MB]